MKYTLDTNLFIDGFRNADDAARLIEFHERYASTEYLSAVVALELRAGSRSASASARLDRHVFAPFETRGRVFAPSYATWKRAGASLAALQRRDAALCNDVLIAASCREHGITLVTRNVRDFARIQTVLSFDFTAAWPQ